MEIVSGEKGGTWESTDKLLPISFKTEIQANPLLIQNQVIIDVGCYTIFT